MIKGAVLDDAITWIAFLSNIFTIFASGIAIYVFFVKRKSIVTVFELLINYTYQLSLSELKENLEKLNEYNANNIDENEKIINILNDIIGQIKGNDKLSKHFLKSMKEIEVFSSGKKPLTEPRKRALVSELRERLRNLNVRTIDHLIGE